MSHETTAQANAPEAAVTKPAKKPHWKTRQAANKAAIEADLASASPEPEILVKTKAKAAPAAALPEGFTYTVEDCPVDKRVVFGQTHTIIVTIDEKTLRFAHVGKPTHKDVKAIADAVIHKNEREERMRREELDRRAELASRASS